MLPFLPIMIAILFLVTYLPAIIMWLPKMLGSFTSASEAGVAPREARTVSERSERFMSVRWC